MTLSESVALDSFNFLSSDEESESNSQTHSAANTLMSDTACHHGDVVTIDDREESGLGSLEGTGSSKGEWVGRVRKGRVEVVVTSSQSTAVSSATFSPYLTALLPLLLFLLSLASLDRHPQLAGDIQYSQLRGDSALSSEGSVTGRKHAKDDVDDLPLPTDATTGVVAIDTVSYF